MYVHRVFHLRLTYHMPDYALRLTPYAYALGLERWRWMERYDIRYTLGTRYASLALYHFNFNKCVSSKDVSARYYPITIAIINLLLCCEHSHSLPTHTTATDRRDRQMQMMCLSFILAAPSRYSLLCPHPRHTQHRGITYRPDVGNLVPPAPHLRPPVGGLLRPSALL